MYIKESILHKMMTSFFIVSLFSGFLLFAPTIYAESPSNSWMSQVPDSTFLKDLNIPGTHESATAKTTIFTSGVASCQEDSIPQQLNNGIRYLDLRLNSDLLINHDGVSCYKSVFKRLYMCDVLDYISEFLTKNPSETVIIQIKEEGNGKSDFQAAVNDILSKYSNVYYSQKPPHTITMGDVRGKILVLNRSRSLNSAYKYSQWADNCAYWKVKIGGSFGLLQDTYKDKDVKTKINHITSFYENIWKDRTRDHMFIICFTSCIGPLNPKIVAKDINKQFEEYVDANRSHRFGIVLMDNPTDSLIYSLYNLNYPH